MKNIFKISTQVVVLITFLMLTNCSRDEFTQQIKNSKNKTDISFEQFKRETGLTNFQTNIKINHDHNSSLMRNADGSYELSDFNISTEIIKKVVIDEKTTYTFQIETIDEEFEDRFFNLTMFYKDGWQSLIIELKPTDENLVLLKQGLTEKFEGTMTRLFQTNMPPVNGMDYCTTVFITNWHCVGGGDCDGTFEGCDWCGSCVDAESYQMCGSDPITAEPYYIDIGPSTTGGGGTGTGTGTGSTGTGSTTNDEIPIETNLEALELDIDGDPNTIDDATNIRKLNKLTKNKSDGTKTKIKERIDQLKIALPTSLKENGSMFDSNQNILPSYNQGSNWTAFANSGLLQYHIILHMHQNFYIPEGSTTPTETPVSPSDTDITNFLKLLKQTDNTNTTSIVLNRIGTFAMRINNKESANNAYDAITAPWANSDTPPKALKEFVDAYDNFVLAKYEEQPLNDQNVMDAFIQFINNFTFSETSNTLGISFYQAVYDNQDNIINWIKL